LPGIKEIAISKCRFGAKGAEGQLVAVITGTNYYFAAKKSC